MFADFHQTLLEWLQKRNRLAVINSIFQTLLAPPEKNPDKLTLWDRFFRTLIPKNHYYFIFHHPGLLGTFTADLAAQGQYTVQKRISNLVERHILRLLPDKDPDLVKRRIFDFHNQLEMWEDGTWHHQIQTNRCGVIDKLKRRVGFEDDWETARFLTDCGYWYPSSRSSLTAWNRYSGEPVASNALCDWWKLLKTQVSEISQMAAIDFTLEHIFGACALPGMPSFCQIPAACFECPLHDNCHHFQTGKKSDSSVYLENLIRMEDIEEIETVQLVSYLAGARWTGTPVQKSLLKAFPAFSPSISANVPKESPDDKFILFLKALQAYGDRHDSANDVTHGIVFNKSEIIYNELKSEIARLKQENFYTLILDNKYRKIALKQITRGTLNQSLVHPREVFAPAIQLRAAAIILIHNHPSGDPHPSNQDVEITKRLREVGNIVGINVLDHVIIARESYFSFVDAELM
ncbi:JAB domain-containing protein [bacterium]|nr:JAB domain-containing protein [bacterium]